MGKARVISESGYFSKEAIERFKERCRLGEMERGGTMGEKSFKKSNNLIYAYSNGSLLAERLFAMGMQNIFVDENNRVVSTMYGDDIKKGLGLISNSIYKRIRELCDRENTSASIYDWMITYKDRESGNMVEHNVVSEASFQNGTLRVIYNSAITDLIVNLSMNYTVLNFTESMSFKTKNSYRLYELIKADYAFKTHEMKKREGITSDYNLTELKLMMGDIDYKSMPLISDELVKDYPDYKRIEDIVNGTGFDNHNGYFKFNEKVLAGAVKELNEKTSQKVEYAPIKEGRVVVGVRFFMS